MTAPAGCYYDEQEHLVCESDDYDYDSDYEHDYEPDYDHAFQHDDKCFKAGYSFVCKEDVDTIHQNGCAFVNGEDVCGDQLYELF